MRHGADALQRTTRSTSGSRARRAIAEREAPPEAIDQIRPQA